MKQYYYRKKKKINTVLKMDQFSGLDGMAEDVQDRFAGKVGKCNDRWATDDALKKHGLERSEGVEEEGKKPAKKAKTKK